MRLTAKGSRWCQDELAEIVALIETPNRDSNREWKREDEERRTVYKPGSSIYMCILSTDTAFERLAIREAGNVGCCEQRTVHIALQSLNAPMNGCGSVMRTELYLDGEHDNTSALIILRKQFSTLRRQSSRQLCA